MNGTKKDTLGSLSTTELLSAYGAAAIRRLQAWDADDIPRANREHDARAEIETELARRNQILELRSLLADPSVPVKLAAAIRLLKEVPDEVRPIVTEIATLEKHGLMSLEAKGTLIATVRVGRGEEMDGYVNGRFGSI